MSQFGRPDADVVNQGFVDQAASSTTIFDVLDEVIASDADYIVSPAAPSNDVYTTHLSDMQDPVASTGHVVRYRYAKSEAAGAVIGLTVQLRLSYVDEGTPGTLIHEATHTNISETPTAGTFTLSGAEADAITDYTELYLRFVFNQS